MGNYSGRVAEDLASAELLKALLREENVGAGLQTCQDRPKRSVPTLNPHIDIPTMYFSFIFLK